MKNLEKKNIRRDEGSISIDEIRNIEKTNEIKLPKLYVNFIINHNGARLNARSFDYDDPNLCNGRNEGVIAFEKAETIRSTIELIQSGEEPDWPTNYRFEDGLIPFGDSGGDMICFDYRKDRTTDNPPIVIWNHEGPDHNPVFIANNFEEFINMLHEPED